MGKLVASILLSLLTIAVAEAQDFVGPGSTVQGDILRGQGQFLKGAAWYELNAAKAFEINSRAAMAIEKWNRQVYDDYMRERAAHIQLRKNMTRAQAEAARKKYEEREARLRTNPTSDDIIKGDALNALLVDLSDPSISLSAWRFAQVPLPPGLSIPTLVFRFAPKPGAKDSQALGRGVIALARLDTIKGNRWGTVLSMDALSQERKAYELAYAKVRDQCLAGNLSLDAPIGLAHAIASLRANVQKAVPAENGYRSAATREVDGLRDAAQIFHAETIDYAREMIADTQRHDAKTVGELLAFMRKYRLLFASAARTLGGGEMYGRLYGLMREQKEKLQGSAKNPPTVADDPKGSAPVQTSNDDVQKAMELLRQASTDLKAIQVKGVRDTPKAKAVPKQVAKAKEFIQMAQSIDELIAGIQGGRASSRLVGEINYEFERHRSVSLNKPNKTKYDQAIEKFYQAKAILDRAASSR